MDERDFKQLEALAKRYGFCSLIENIITTLPPAGQRCRDAQALADKLNELAAWVGNSYQIW
jgi:hypothetical protein